PSSGTPARGCPGVSSTGPVRPSAPRVASSRSASPIRAAAITRAASAPFSGPTSRSGDPVDNAKARAPSSREGAVASPSSTGGRMAAFSLAGFAVLTGRLGRRQRRTSIDEYVHQPGPAGGLDRVGELVLADGTRNYWESLRLVDRAVLREDVHPGLSRDARDEAHDAVRGGDASGKHEMADQDAAHGESASEHERAHLPVHLAQGFRESGGVAAASRQPQRGAVVSILG